MRVYVNDNEGTNIRICIPTGLLLNRLTAMILSKVLTTAPGIPDKMKLSNQQLYCFLKIIKDYKKNHPGWKLVEVHSADGDVVEITL